MLRKTSVLSQDSIIQIHLHIMDVLEYVGIRCEEKDSLKIFEQAGAKVDYTEHRVYLPANLVKQTLNMKPDSISFYDSYGVRSCMLGGSATNYTTCGYATSYLDQEGNYKKGTYDALLEEAEIVDAIDLASFIHPSIQPTDKPAELQDLYMVKALLTKTRKPIHCVANSGKNAEAIVEMHAEVIGGLEMLKKKPRHMFNITTFSPLTIRKDACEVIRVAAKYKTPCMFSTGTMAGATAPVTLAGSIVQSMAEVIGHITLLQLQGPGTPASMLHASRIFDMKFGSCTVGTPEFSLLRIAGCQMAKYYGIPIGGLSLLTDSNDLDSQYGWEKFMTCLLPVQADLNLVFGMGMFSQLNMFSFEALALDVEIIRAVERLVKGFEVDDESIAYQIIEEEAKTSSFLTNTHTLKHFKNEFMMPGLTDRTIYAKWITNENKDIRDRAKLQLQKYRDSYNYSKGLEFEDALQKIITNYE